MGGTLTPETLPAQTRCRELLIPDDPLILAAVNGAISALCDDWHWQPFGAVTPAQMAEAMTAMYADYLDSECSGGEEVSPFEPGDLLMTFRSEGGLPMAKPGFLLLDGSSYPVEDYPNLADAMPQWVADGFITLPNTFRHIPLDGHEDSVPGYATAFSPNLFPGDPVGFPPGEFMAMALNWYVKY